VGGDILPVVNRLIYLLFDVLQFDTAVGQQMSINLNNQSLL